MLKFLSNFYDIKFNDSYIEKLYLNYLDMNDIFIIQFPIKSYIFKCNFNKKMSFMLKTKRKRTYIFDDVIWFG